VKTIEVDVPNAEDYQIDTFLGNIIMYKISEEWNYLHNVELPHNELKIIEVKKIENKTWLIIQIL